MIVGPTGIGSHARNPNLHPPAYGSASYALDDLRNLGAAYPSYADISAQLQVTITADGVSPIVVEFFVPAMQRGTASSGIMCIGVREGTSTPVCGASFPVAAANTTYAMYARSLPFVPTQGSHTYKACCSYIGGGADLGIAVPSAEFKPVLEITGRRSS